MSYRGFIRFLCENGHLTEFDSYMTDFIFDEAKNTTTPTKLCRCGKRFVWHEDIDETNGTPKFVDKPLNECEEDEMPNLKLVAPLKYEDCPTCGQRRILERERFMIPTDHGTRI